MESTDESRDMSALNGDGGTVALLNKSEIDMQVATAHRYPRSIKRFRDEFKAGLTTPARELFPYEASANYARGGGR